MHAASSSRRSCAVIVLLLSLGAPVSAQRGGVYASESRQNGAIPQLVTLDLQDVTLREALTAIAEQGRISLVYSSGAVPLERRVSLSVHAVPAAEALRAALRGTEVEVREAGSGQVMLIRRTGPEAQEKQAKTGTIGGHVIDATTNAPVVRALVTIEAGRWRTTTNDGGQYRLADISAGAHTVEVRRIGYAPATRSIVVFDNADASLDFSLTPVASRLNEVVTTVTGPQRRLEVGNVIGTIDADSVVREAPITSLSDLLTARVPGTQVVLFSGLTGMSPRVRIRGLNSAAVSNDPLLYVDGVRVDNSAGSLVSGFGQRAGRLNDLNPDEIESIEIVKGPSAATLYGTDAANGVIVVRTKRGHPGRALWAVRSEVGLVDEPSRFLDNYFSWGHAATTGVTQKCLLTAAAAGTCVIDSLTTFNPFENAATTPIGLGRRAQYGGQVSGGVERFTYLFAGDVESETGYLKMPDGDVQRVSAERGVADLPAEQLRPNAERKLSLRTNVGAALTQSADAMLSLGVVSSNTRIPGNGIFFGYFGSGYRDAQDGWYSVRPGEAFAVRNSEDVTHYTASLSGNWRPRSWLSTRATLGSDVSGAFLDGLQRRDEGPTSSRTGRRINSNTSTKLYTADLGASATVTPAANISSRTSVGAQFNRQQMRVTTATGSNLPPGSQTVTGAAVISGAEQTIESVVAGSYVEETIGIHDRLFLTGALRVDGGSNFGKDFHTAVYPKASLSWVVPMTGRSLRLRAAYGASGVQPAATAALPLETLFATLVNGTTASGAAPSAIGNPLLRPERQREVETGFDVDMLNDRVRIEATYYNRSSRDALVNRPLGTDVGVASRWENIGSVRNRGIEGLLWLQPIDRAIATWDVSLNGSIDDNKVLDLGGVTSSAFMRVGYPLYGRFERPIIGYADANNNGIIEVSELRMGDTAVYRGPSFPPRQLTANSALSLLKHRLRVSTQFDYRGGHRLENTTELSRCIGAIGNCRAVNDITAPLSTQAAALAFTTTSSRDGYLEDGSFVRWRELSISYSLPDALAHRVRATTSKVTALGRNLKLFTRYSGVDPEVNAQPGRTDLEGYGDSPTAPQARYWLLRVDFGF
jgi:TonB-dependent SusC/RagA subfamily outer membrane receptor